MATFTPTALAKMMAVIDKAGNGEMSKEGFMIYMEQEMNISATRSEKLWDKIDKIDKRPSPPSVLVDVVGGAQRRQSRKKVTWAQGGLPGEMPAVAPVVEPVAAPVVEQATGARGDIVGADNPFAEMWQSMINSFGMCARPRRPPCTSHFGTARAPFGREKPTLVYFALKKGAEPSSIAAQLETIQEDEEEGGIPANETTYQLDCKGSFSVPSSPRISKEEIFQFEDDMHHSAKSVAGG